jgi:hypothetical protein
VFYLQYGRNLPCINSAIDTEVNLNKSDAVRSFDDYGLLPVGPSCPVNRQLADPLEGSVKDNQFRALIVYELPPQATIIADRKISPRPPPKKIFFFYPRAKL